jgi:hypothetical protein
MKNPYPKIGKASCYLKDGFEIVELYKESQIIYLSFKNLYHLKSKGEER